MMPIGGARFAACAVTNFQELFAGVGDHYALALEHINEFVFAAMPMPLA